MRRTLRTISLLMVGMVLMAAAGCREEKAEERPLEEARIQKEETEEESEK